MIAIGGTNIVKAYLGQTELANIAIGDELLLGSEPISYIDWIKSMGCITWLPLSSEGDLTDRITGLSLQLTGYGSLTWDATAGMYKVKNPSNTVGRHVAWLDNGMTASDFPDNCFTSLTSFQKITSTGYAAASQISPKSTNSNTIASLNPTYNGIGNVANYPNELLKLAEYVGNDKRVYIQQGNIYTEKTPYVDYLPSNWVTTGSGLALGIIRSSTNSYYNKEYYVKDIYIFKKKLSLGTIRQIQGYDPLPSWVIT